ncbi:MAG: hypothetical protein GEU82_12055 [Luteitalea sp.]|nr:hypothetical protein [Luteitalea sp.]
MYATVADITLPRHLGLRAGSKTATIVDDWLSAERELRMGVGFTLPNPVWSGFMNDPPYRQAFERIRAEYLEMPGMRLTPAQVQRLSGVHVSICALVLEDLVRAQFLHMGPDGGYARASVATDDVLALRGAVAKAGRL